METITIKKTEKALLINDNDGCNTPFRVTTFSYYGLTPIHKFFESLNEAESYYDKVK